MRSSRIVLVGPNSTDWCPSKIRTQTHTDRERSHDTEAGRGCHDEAVIQGVTGATRNWKRQEGSSRASRGNTWLC